MPSSIEISAVIFTHFIAILLQGDIVIETEIVTKFEE